MNEEEYVSGGYVLLPRKLFQSPEWSGRSLLHRALWVYLFAMANHANAKGFQRGQIRTSLPALQEALSYYVGYRLVRPSRRSLWRSIEGLRERHAIVTMKVTHGILITICNYERYQTPSNYERHDDSPAKVTTNAERTSRHGHNENKNDKNEKKEKKLSAALASPPVENGERRLPETPALDLALRWEELLKLDSRPRSEQKDTGDFRALMTAGEDVLTGKLGQPRQSQDTLTTLAHQIGNRDEPATSPLGMFLAEVGKMRLRQARKAP